MKQLHMSEKKWERFEPPVSRSKRETNRADITKGGSSVLHGGPERSGYEREADLVTERIMGSLAGRSNMSRLAGLTEASGRNYTSGLIPGDIQQLFHEWYDLDPGDPVVHTGVDADRKSRSLHAFAYTRGKEIFFRNHQWEPEREEGRRLIVHELVHMVQQHPDAGGTVVTSTEVPFISNAPVGVQCDFNYHGSPASEVWRTYVHNEILEIIRLVRDGSYTQAFERAEYVADSVFDMQEFLEFQEENFSYAINYMNQKVLPPLSAATAAIWQRRERFAEGNNFIFEKLQTALSVSGEMLRYLRQMNVVFSDD